MSESVRNTSGLAQSMCKHGEPFAATDAWSPHEQRRIRGADGQWLQYEGLWVVTPVSGGTWVRAKYLDTNGQCRFAARVNQIEQAELSEPLPDDFAVAADYPHDGPTMTFKIVPAEWVQQQLAVPAGA